MMNNDEAMCPWCKKEQSDSSEWIDDATYGTISVECGYCEKPFSLFVEFTVHYHTERTPDPEKKDGEG